MLDILDKASRGDSNIWKNASFFQICLNLSFESFFKMILSIF